MQTIFQGDLTTRIGRLTAWLDSLLIDHGLLRTIWTNFYTVVPGVLCPSNHPTPANLRLFVREQKLRSVLNLRGRSQNGSDALSREAINQLSLVLIDLPLKSNQAPKRDQILNLIGAFETMDTPALLHCKSGADRAGLASAIFQPAVVAKKQLSLRFGHLKRARTGIFQYPEPGPPICPVRLQPSPTFQIENPGAFRHFPPEHLT
jgi:protein tyrosine phosphatase (PTP) superfamily phosphohydrolase (DUF442 family)